MNSTRWTCLLLVALLGDLLVSAWTQSEKLSDLLHGDYGREDALTLVWLALSAIALVASFGVARSFFTTRASIYRTTQSLAADASMSPDWVWESDEQTRITYSSHGVEALLGYCEEEVLGLPSINLLFDEAGREQAQRTLAAAQSSMSGWTNTEFNWRHKNGHSVSLQGSAVPLYDQKHTLIGFRGTRRLLTPGILERDLVAAAAHRVNDMLRTRSFDIALQPIVDLTSGRLTGVEALARFHDGRSPDLWFRDAHDCGQSHALEEAAFTAALRVVHALPEQAYLSVNASPALLMNPAFRERLSALRFPLDRLVIEITEHAKVLDYAELNVAIGSLRERGVRLGIDDTGAGYASLNHVVELRPDIIKLDRALISRLNDDRARRSLVTALVLLALDMGAAITAEGVETNDQLEALMTLGVDQGQGYLLAKPTLDKKKWQQWAGHRWSVHPQGLPASTSS